MDDGILSGLLRVLAFVLAKVCVKVRVVIVQIHTDLALVVCGSSWSEIVFVKPWVHC
jgi:hypothetical protein